jgi:hypothetical protein
MVTATSRVLHAEACRARWPWQPALRVPKYADCAHRDDPLMMHRSAPLAVIVATRS